MNGGERLGPYELVSRMLWMAALLALAAVAAWLALRPRAGQEVIEAAIATPENSGISYLSGPPALSPDGRFLAYCASDTDGRRKIWLRSIERGTSRPIEGTELAVAPFWSADGRFIAFTINGQVKKIPLSGGSAETIVTGAGTGWSWSRDGVVLHVGSGSAGIHRVPAAGGESRAVVEASSIGAAVTFWPVFLPDGKHFLFVASGGGTEQRGQAGIWVAALDGSMAPRFLTRSATNAQYAEPGFLLFGRDGMLRAQPFDARKLRVTGESQTIAPIQIFSVTALFTVSGNGLLVYQPPGSSPLTDLMLKNRKGETIGKVAEKGFFWAPRLSPDGRRVAVDRSDDGARGDIWIIGPGAATTRVSFDPLNESSPVWSPAGDEILYAMDRPPIHTVLLRKRLEGPPQPVLPHGAYNVTPADWSPDGRYLSVDRFVASGFDAVVWSLSERKWIEVAATSAREGRMTFSPDGRWVVYQSDESGRYEIYAQPFPPTGAKYQVSTEGGITPRWTRTGEIVWVDLSNRLNAAKVETAPSFTVGTPEALFSIEQQVRFTHQYDVTPDGNFLVNAVLPTPPKPMTLLVNWHRRLAGESH